MNYIPMPLPQQVTTMEMGELAAQFGVARSRFADTVIHDFGGWINLTTVEFRAFIKLAQLESIAGLVNFNPGYDPYKKTLSFQYYDDPNDGRHEISAVDTDSPDLYMDYLYDALCADHPEYQPQPEFGDYLKKYFPEAYEVWSSRIPVTPKKQSQPTSAPAPNPHKIVDSLPIHQAISPAIAIPAAETKRAV